ncbi:MAG: hypothetical protein WD274_08245 [Acidimicrobiia bacterium]
MTDIKEELRVAIPPEDPEDEVDGSPEPQPADAARTPVPLWKKAVAVGAWIVAAFALTVAFGNLRGDPAPDVAAGVVLTSIPVAVEIPPDTLGIRFDEVHELWNSIEQAPSISQPLRRMPESGELDAFRHGFDTSAELIGALRDSDGYLVALMTRSSVEHPNVSTLYLHMCHVINPFSPECIDNYFATGLGGQTLEELASGHSTSWTYEGNEWRVSIEGKLLSIRVLAPDSN